jgi:predicted Zn-dependent protease
MNEQDTILLDNYFNGLLTSAEAAQVQARTSTDATFAAEFALRQKMEAWPRQSAQRQVFAESLATLGAEFFTEKKLETPAVPPLTARTNWTRWVLAAAASIALLLAATWFFQQPSGALYEQYAGQHAPLALSDRSTDSNAAAEADAAFNGKNYSAALAALDRLLAAQPANSTAQLYRGICLLELQRPAEARTALQPLAAGTSALRADAQWYTALAFLQEKNRTECRAMLRQIAPGEAHYEQAVRLLAVDF